MQYALFAVFNFLPISVCKQTQNVKFLIQVILAEQYSYWYGRKAVSKLVAFNSVKLGWSAHAGKCRRWNSQLVVRTAIVLHPLSGFGYSPV